MNKEIDDTMNGLSISWEKKGRNTSAVAND